MSKPFNTKALTIIVTLSILILIAKFISLILWLYLPSDGINANDKESYIVKYQRIDFKTMIKASKSSKEQTSPGTIATTNISNLILTGVYGNKFHGFAILAATSAPHKTKIIATGEKYSGYTLKEIRLNEVTFNKDSKEFILKLENKSKIKLKDVITKVTHTSQATHTLSKNDITNYSKNPTEIWKDISISEVKKNGKIEGFKVTRIKRDSKMAQLGLKKGDIIIKANNIELTSYKDAIKIYQDIDKIDTVELIIKRNNEEKEIIYEIN